MSIALFTPLALWISSLGSVVVVGGGGSGGVGRFAVASVVDCLTDGIEMSQDFWCHSVFLYSSMECLGGSVQIICLGSIRRRTLYV